MTDRAQSALDSIQRVLEQSTEHLPAPDYFDVLEELAGHLQCLIDCYKEEHREDFE